LLTINFVHEKTDDRFGTRQLQPRIKLLKHPALLNNCEIVEFMCAVSTRLVEELKVKAQPLLKKLFEYGKEVHDDDFNPLRRMVEELPREIAKNPFVT
jgi:hypothetical protein